MDESKNNLYLKSIRKKTIDIKSKINAAKTELSHIWKSISNTDYFFGDVPTTEEVRYMEQQLDNFVSGNGTIFQANNRSDHNIDLAKQGIELCQNLYQFLPLVKNIKEKKVTKNDILNLVDKLSKNKILHFIAVDAIWENLMENIGVQIGSNAINNLSSLIQKVGPPCLAVGMLSAIYQTFSGTPLSQGNTCILKLTLLISLLLLQYRCDWIENLGTPLVDALGCHVAELFFGYLGMSLAGTGESLPEYAEKMTLCMAFYHLAWTGLEKSGFGYYSNLLLSTYISHVGYQMSAYIDLFRGTLLSDFLNVTQYKNELYGNIHVTDFEIKNALNKTSSLNYLKKGSRVCKKALSGSNKYFDALSGLSPHLIPSCMAIHQLLENSEKYLEQDLRNSFKAANQYVQQLKQQSQSDELSFLIKEAGQFFIHIEGNSEWQALIESFKKEVAKIFKNSKIDQMGRYQSKLKSLKESFIYKALRDIGIDEKSASDYKFLIAEEMDKQIPVQFRSFLEKNISTPLENQLETLRPIMFPSVNEQERVCALLLQEVLLKAFFTRAIFGIAMTPKEQLAKKFHKATKEEFQQFLVSATKFFLDIQFSSQDGSGIKFQRTAVQKLIHSQMHLAPVQPNAQVSNLPDDIAEQNQRVWQSIAATTFLFILAKKADFATNAMRKRTLRAVQGMTRKSGKMLKIGGYKASQTAKTLALFVLSSYLNFMSDPADTFALVPKEPSHFSFPEQPNLLMDKFGSHCMYPSSSQDLIKGTTALAHYGLCQDWPEVYHSDDAIPEPGYQSRDQNLSLHAKVRKCQGDTSCISSAYRKEITKFHPDIHQHPAADAMTKKITSQYNAYKKTLQFQKKRVG